MNNRYFVYIRRSQDREDQQTASVPAQKRELEEYAKRNNLKIVDTFIEEKSAYHPGREIFNNMLERLEKGEATAVLTWSTSRIARNAQDGGRFIQMISDEIIKELRTPNKIYQNNSDDKFMLNIFFSMDQKSSDEKKDYVYRGNSQRIREGVYPGRAKQGYLNYIDPITKVKSIVIDNIRYPLIKNAFHKILYEHLTPMESLNWVNSKGYKTRVTNSTGGKPISTASWYRMLSDPFYYGYIARKEAVGYGNHKPMLTKDEFDRLQEILGKKTRAKITKRDFPFKDLLVCGNCGGSITAHEKIRITCSKCKHKFALTKSLVSCTECGTKIDESNIYKYVYYHCTRKKDKSCTEGAIRLSTLTSEFLALLDRFEITEEYKDLAIRFLNENTDVDFEINEVTEQNLLQQAQDIKLELKNLLKLKISPLNSNGELLTDQKYHENKKELEGNLKDLEELLTDNKHQLEEKISEAEEVFNFARYATYWFNDGTSKQKTEIMRKVGLKLEIKDRKLRIYGETPYYLIEKGKKKIEDIKQGFETQIKAGTATNKDLEEAIIQSWRAHCLTGGTLIQQCYKDVL